MLSALLINSSRSIDDTLTLVELALETGEEDVYDEAKADYDFILADLETQKAGHLALR